MTVPTVVMLGAGGVLSFYYFLLGGLALELYSLRRREAGAFSHYTEQVTLSAHTPALISQSGTSPRRGSGIGALAANETVAA